MARAIRISELICQLQEIAAEYGDLPVATQGCDCVGPASGTEYYRPLHVGDLVDKPARVIIQRDDTAEYEDSAP